MPLRVVPPRGAGCEGCSRRAVLRGLAIGAASSLVGCPGMNIEPPAPDAGEGSTTSMCGSSDLCLDLDDAPNALLNAVDGWLTVRSSRDILVVIRTSTTALVALSDVCTHLGCGVRYNRVN